MTSSADGETEAQQGRFHTQGHRAKEAWPLLYNCLSVCASQSTFSLERGRGLFTPPGMWWQTTAPAGIGQDPCWHPDHPSQGTLGITPVTVTCPPLQELKGPGR